jgi:hypothetical protein
MWCTTITLLLILGVLVAPEVTTAQTRGKLSVVGVLYPIQGSTRFHTHRQRIMDLARMHRLPTVCAGRQYMEAGCLIAYNPSLVARFRRAAPSTWARMLKDGHRTLAVR